MGSPPGLRSEITSWSKSSRSLCFVYKVKDMEEIVEALAIARAQHLSMIPHGAGHSYTDAALNTNGLVIDTTSMHQILAWDPVQGIMKVEPGVTLRELVQIASKDGWWPFVSPSSPEVTIGGCVAMNVNDRNAWKFGPFGEYVISIDVLLMTGELCTIMQERDLELFRAFVGSLGLLGIITSITLQLQRSPGFVFVRRHSAISLSDILNTFAEEEHESDYMEAWLDGFAEGRQLGRGHITCATLSKTSEESSSKLTKSGANAHFEKPLVSLAATLMRAMLMPSVRLATRANYWWGKQSHKTLGQQRRLLSYTYWPSAAFTAYHAMFPTGVETFQAFVPREHAREIFEQVLRYSQQQDCLPIWCIIKQHKCDPFLLSYQVDGFSLELNYQRTYQGAHKLQRVLQHMITTVIEAGGKFYLAKDHFMTPTQYRQSVGDEVIETFLQIKQRYDPERLLQSDLYRRIFQPLL
ncbi:MAG: FAD-binding oxidoreductase [Anaerolineales bacterium]